MQIGCRPEGWPLALTKELIDNALDACETASVSPVITVTLDGASVTVADNGPGLPEATLTKSLDYASRTSDKSYYVSPTRGQLGNALKCMWAGPFVYSGEELVPYYVGVLALAHADETRSVAVANELARASTTAEA